MPSETWYCHIQGETFGPVPTDVVTIMLRQNRLQFSDWIWTGGLTKWMRIGDLHQFAAFLPPYPAAPIPAQEAVVPSHEVPTPTSVAAAVPVVAAPRPVAPAPPAPVAAPSPPPTPRPTTESSARAAPRAESPLKAWIRRYGRVRLNAKVVIEGYGTYDSADISEGGIFIKASSPIPFGTDLKLLIEAPFLQKPLDMTGIVIREGASEEGDNGFAIQFTRVNPAHRRLIHDYVKSQTTSVE